MQDRFDFQITKMTAGHIAQIADIEAEVFSMPWSAQAFADTLAMEQALFYTALAGGKAAGYCGMYMAADEGEIVKVAAAPWYRRRKIAETLLLKILSEAYAKNVRRIFLEVRISNDAAVRLYEKTGFVRAGIRRGFYRFPAEDALVMMHESADNII